MKTRVDAVNMKGWLDKYADGGRISREIPEITVYGKKSYLQELDKQQQKYLADMAKYKQDSIEWTRANKAYQDSLHLYNSTKYFSEKAPQDILSRQFVEFQWKRGKPVIRGLQGNIEPYKDKTPLWNMPTDKNEPVGYLGSNESKVVFLDVPIYKKPSNVLPKIPSKPVRTNVNYDSTYENLRMRPLWATMAKQDTTSKIGTLNPLDPLYEKGFTYGEAQKFPEEIRKQYKLDYPIYESGGVITKAENGEQISREDYLRQQYQNYLKEEANKGRQAVQKGMYEVGRDYLVPAMKIAGSFTPAGPIIGLMDAYEAYQKGNTNSAIVSAGMEALPYGSKYIGKGIKALSNTLIDNKDAIKLAYYSKAPWTWKPNPNYYYRAGKGSEFLDDVVERNEIRAVNPNSYAYLRDQGLINGIRDVNTGKIALKAKTFPVADTYWSKGVPLDGRYSNQNYGDHIIEASDDIPFVNSVNQRTKQKGFWDAPDVNYNSTHVRGSYVKPRQSYGYDEKGEIQPSIGTPLLYDADKIKLYKPHWLKGYKEIPKKGQGGIVPNIQKPNKLSNFTSGWLDKYE